MNVCRFFVSNSLYLQCASRSFYTSNVLYKVQKPHSYSNKKSELNLRKLDGLSESYRIVYNAPMKNYINAANIVSFGSLFGIVGYGSYRVYLTTCILGLPISHIFDRELTNFSQLDIGVFLSGFILTNLLLWKVSSHYALRIYKKENSSRYCCIMTGLLPMTSRRIEFKAGDIKRASGIVVSKLPWKHQYFSIGPNKIILLQNYFRTPSDFHEMSRFYEE